MKTFFKPFALAALLVAGTASASPPMPDSYSDKQMMTINVQPVALPAAPTDVNNITIESAWTSADLFLLDAPPDVGWRTMSTEIDEYNCNFDFSVSSVPAVMWVDPDVGPGASVINTYKYRDLMNVSSTSVNRGLLAPFMGPADNDAQRRVNMGRDYRLAVRVVPLRTPGCS